MKVRGTVVKLAAGFVLAVLGVILSLVQGGQPVEPSRAAETYTTNWQAQKLITACCWDYGGTQDGGGSGLPVANSREIAIGVSEWKVTGTINGEAAFEEVWKTPAVGAKNTRLGSDTVYGRFLPEPADSGFDASKWLLGVVHIEGVGGAGSVATNNDTIFAEKSVGQINFHLPNQVGGGSFGKPYLASNGALTCTREGSTDSGCRVATGAYGWLDLLGTFSDRPTVDHTSAVAAGLLMPLEWQVSGTIF